MTQMNPNNSMMYVLNSNAINENNGLKQQIDGLSADNEQLRRKLSAKNSECDKLKQQIKDTKLECDRYKQVMIQLNETILSGNGHGSGRECRMPKFNIDQLATFSKLFYFVLLDIFSSLFLSRST